MDASALQAVLDGIESGRVPLEIVEPPEYCNYPKYKADGWTFCVFDDCWSWDYFEWVESPDGERVEYSMTPYEDMTDLDKLVDFWGPSDCRVWGYDYK